MAVPRAVGKGRRSDDRRRGTVKASLADFSSGISSATTGKAVASLIPGPARAPHGPRAK